MTFGLDTGEKWSMKGTLPRLDTLLHWEWIKRITSFFNSLHSAMPHQGGVGLEEGGGVLPIPKHPTPPPQSHQFQTASQLMAGSQLKEILFTTAWRRYLWLWILTATCTSQSMTFGLDTGEKWSMKGTLPRLDTLLHLEWIKRITSVFQQPAFSHAPSGRGRLRRGEGTNPPPPPPPPDTSSRLLVSLWQDPAQRDSVHYRLKEISMTLNTV